MREKLAELTEPLDKPELAILSALALLQQAFSVDELHIDDLCEKMQASRQHILLCLYRLTKRQLVFQHFNEFGLTQKGREYLALNTNFKNGLKKIESWLES